MCIEEIMDCEGCESLHYVPGRAWGDPDVCYPDEGVCGEGAPEDGPCERMLGAIADMINDGEVETSEGFLASGEFLRTAALDDMGFCEEHKPAWYGVEDFSSAPYWFINFDPAVFPAAYKNVKIIYKEFFV
jgi:hypothetical protein